LPLGIDRRNITGRLGRLLARHRADRQPAFECGRVSTTKLGSPDCVAVAEVPETRFTNTPGDRIAYQVAGNGPIDLLVAHGLIFPIDLMWDEPSLLRFLDRLSSFSRHVWFDPRGRGASDPLPHAEERLAETMADDMLALVDELGCEQVVAVGLDAPTPILFAASHPERTKALVLVNTGCRFVWGSENFGPSAGIEQWRSYWATGEAPSSPSVAGDARLQRWLGRSRRLLCTADEGFWRFHASQAVDLRPALASVQAPTLFLNRQGPFCNLAQAREDAGHIRGAKVVELPGDDFLFFVGDTGRMLDAIEEFLTGQLPAHHSDRVLATVLYTDIVGSTEHAARIGDRRWKELLGAHDALLTGEVERFRGRLVNSTGDGVLATFDGPGRAIPLRLRDPRLGALARHRRTSGAPHGRDRATGRRRGRGGGAHRGEGVGDRWRRGGARLFDGQGPRRRVGHRV
jgi:pimeloyl-ACP methyl ester carboxylesterase